MFFPEKPSSSYIMNSSIPKCSPPCLHSSIWLIIDSPFPVIFDFLEYIAAVFNLFTPNN